MASFPVDFVLNKLSQLATYEANLLLGLDDEIGHIKRKLEFLEVLLTDADQKRRGKQHPKVGVWVKQLREVAYQLEDVLDEYAVKLDLQRMGISGWRASPWLRCCINPTTQIITRHELASQIREIKVTLEEIASDKAMFLDPINLPSSSQDSSADIGIKLLRTEVEAEPTGQNTYIKKLIPQILECNSQRPVTIPIFGMGGLGKTTLAKRLFNDREVISHFDHCAWLTISQTFSFVDLLKRLMKEFNVKGDTTDEEEMKIKVKNHLNKKRFIIVLDDVWDINSWKYLKTIFPSEHEGITVLLTTRDKKIATDVNPDGGPFELQPLESDESWQLFCKKAFADANCPTNLEVFKQTVIERSKRLPLAVVVLGGLLRKTKDPNQWKKILEQSWREEDEIESILSLSYDYLPPYLKSCFLYVAGYPEDFIIEAEPLKLMWIAEGFIRQQQGQSLEDSAESCLEDLIQRSLLMLGGRDNFGQVLGIRVHDLILDMARKEAAEINFVYHKVPQQSSVIARRLSIYSDGDDAIREQLCSLNSHSSLKLRSFHLHDRTDKWEVSKSNWQQDPIKSINNLHPMKFVRVLSLVRIRFVNGKCPKAIGNMIQLRYLSFRSTNLEELPDNISNLQNLQTLDTRATKVKRIPKKFWEITSLRHVMGGGKLEINPSYKREVSKLNELQTLWGEMNSEWILKDGLKRLINIRRLSMYGVSTTHGDEMKDCAKVEEKLMDAIANLKQLTTLYMEKELALMNVLTASNTSLQRLALRRRTREMVEVRRNSSDLPQPLLNLHTLILYKMNVREEEMEVIGLLPNLRSLWIRDDEALRKLVFKEGYFACLQKLTLFACSKLESWEVWSNSTLMLQYVNITDCRQLKMLPDGLKVEIVLDGTTYLGKAWAREMRHMRWKHGLIKWPPAPSKYDS